MEDDVLPNLPNMTINQKFIKLTPEMRIKFDELSPKLGLLMNHFLNNQLLQGICIHPYYSLILLLFLKKDS